MIFKERPLNQRYIFSFQLKEDFNWKKKWLIRFPVTDNNAVLVKLYYQLLFCSPFQFPDVLNGYGYRITCAAWYFRKASYVPFFHFSTCHNLKFYHRIIIRLLIRRCYIRPRTSRLLHVPSAGWYSPRSHFCCFALLTQFAAHCFVVFWYSWF